MTVAAATHPAAVADVPVADLLVVPIDQPAPETDPEPPAPHEPAVAKHPAEVPFGVDTPARGLPKAIADPGKQITGGFGDAGEALYYALDGSEVKVLAVALCDDIVARLDDDLRFGPATVYPRVHVSVTLKVEGYGMAEALEISKFSVDGQRTPIEIARQHADEICFVVLSERVEMTPDGESVNPPNAIRAELALQIPRKQQVVTSSGQKIFVDLVDNVEPRVP